MAYCSPIGKDNYEKDKTCFSKSALIRLIQIWNHEHPENKIKKISGGTELSKKELLKELNAKMENHCKGKDKDTCWVDTLSGAKKDDEIGGYVLPEKPATWYKKPYEWLTNYDIEKVMNQYEDDEDLKYKFLGVYPIDFASTDNFGRCLFKEMCSLNIVNLYKEGYRYIGLITNLDKHDQSGSHWTSLFACIDPTKKCFGAYYYDSATGTPPPEIKAFMDKLKSQAALIAKLTHSNTEFKTDYNENRHQYGHSECGLFSMGYQLRWLDKLKKYPNITFAQIEKVKINDMKIHKLRNILYRPNRAIEVPRKPAASSRQ
jgi:hypothetical protein